MSPEDASLSKGRIREGTAGAGSREVEGEGPGKGRPARELLSLKAYATRRAGAGLPGTTISAVFRAIRDGRISRTCPAHDRCPPGCSDGKIDPIRADAEWARNSDPPRRGYTRAMREARAQRSGETSIASPELSSAAGEAIISRHREPASLEASDRDSWDSELTASDYRREFVRWKAIEAEMLAKTRAGSLVDREAVWRGGFRIVRGLRDSLLELPRRLAPQVAALSEVREIEELLRGEVRRALEGAVEVEKRAGS